MNARTLIKFMPISVALIWSIACSEKSSDQQRGAPTGASLLPDHVLQLSEDPFEDRNLEISDAHNLADNNEDLYWALANCDCLDGSRKQLLTQAANNRGVLPQSLVPTIRLMIKNNDSLAILDSLPDGLADLATDFFANDEKIATQIRDGIGEMLQSSTPGGSSLSSLGSFRFDAFPSLARQSKHQSTFHYKDLLARWMIVFGSENLWSNRSALGSDHSLQVLELMRTLSEWKYLFGLDARPEGGSYGGLTLDVESDGKTIAGAFDPRSGEQLTRFFSGTYQVDFPAGSTLDLATNAKETWQVANQETTIGDQARTWLISAMAFKRLRPENRSAISSMFGEDKVLPDNAHQLGLAFLPGLQGLLGKYFINKDERAIFASAQFNGVAATRASLLDMARLARALTFWASELQDLSNAKLEASTEQQLSTATENMKPAIQLTVQTILKDFTTSSESVGIALQVKGKPIPSVAIIGETLTSLVEAERKMLPSPLLRAKITAIYHWFVGEVLKSKDAWTGEEMIWALQSLKTYQKEYDADDAWVQSGIDSIAGSLGSWEKL